MATPSNGAPSSERRVKRYAWIAALGATLSFLPSLTAKFVYDDILLISENPYARSLRYLFRGFRTHLWDVFAYGASGFGLRYYRPLVTASYVVNWAVSGGAPWAFHLFNVLCHALTVLLAVRVAARWTANPALGLMAGLVFAIHPTRTESVIWVSGRTDVLMALFLLLAVELVWSAAYAERMRSVRMGAAVAALALALFSKEAAAATALLVVVDRFVAVPNSAPQRRLTISAVVFAVLGVSYVVVRSIVYPVAGARHWEITPRYGLYTVWAYFERIAFPWPQTFFYRPVVEQDGKPYFQPILLLLGTIVTVAFVATVATAYRRDRAACLLLVSGAVFIAPLLNFAYTGIYVTTSDHFLYLPLLLWSVGLLRLFRDRLTPLLGVRALRIAFGGVLVLFAAVDVVRVLDYQNNSAFWSHEVELNPDNPVALTELSRMAAASGDLGTASALVKKAMTPASVRFFLLAGARGARIATRARMLALDAGLRADGDVRALEEVYDGLESLLTICRSEDGDILGPVGVLEAASRNGQVASIVSDAALLGTRLGRTARAEQLAAAIPADMVWQVPNPLNLVLTYARLGQFARARKTLALARNPPSGIAPFGSEQTLNELGNRIREAEALFIRTRNEPEDRARVDAATAYAVLGAYLQALRVLRPAFEHGRDAPGVAPLYVQLLVSARLDDEALATAKSILGSEQGATVVEGLRGQLTPRVRSLKKPDEPSPWWNG